MTDIKCANTLSWVSIGSVHGKSHSIPSCPGIYAYGEVERVGGLPVQTRWVYIGQSRNLAKRISVGHDARRESNEALRTWFRKARKDVELWFAPVPLSDLDKVERALIQQVQPDFNKKHK
jgi:excinuclease UvrABC nuclease subunit